MSKPILIVEDEISLGETLVDYLKKQGHDAYWANTVTKARELFSQINSTDTIVLMDIGLPDGNGIELSKEFLKISPMIKILFLSAQNDPDTRVSGLEAGALDFITKPFNLKELLLRLDRLGARSVDQQSISDELKIGSIKIWFSRFQIQDGTQAIIQLGQKECEILKLLYLQRNKAIHRDKIISQVWGEDVFPSNRTVDNYIVRLRKILDSDPQKKATIESIRAVGYKLTINN